MSEESKEEKKEESTQVESEETKEEAKAEKPEAPVEKVEEKKEEKKAEKPAPSGKFKDLIKQIEELSVKDLAELVKELEDRFGVSAIAPMAVAGGGQAVGANAAAEEEKAEYTVMLTDAGAQKIAVIKAVREIRPDLGLKEAKDLVDGAPKEVKANVPTEEAKEAQKKLETAGAKVELK